uniref:Uncharacterized protein n=1 Tax=Triticum urartu TaxID=4572 RepID=A0A8R7U1E7_TRIUA
LLRSRSASSPRRLLFFLATSTTAAADHDLEQWILLLRPRPRAAKVITCGVREEQLQQRQHHQYMPAHVLGGAEGKYFQCHVGHLDSRH